MENNSIGTDYSTLEIQQAFLALPKEDQDFLVLKHHIYANSINKTLDRVRRKQEKLLKSQGNEGEGNNLDFVTTLTRGYQRPRD